MFEQEVSYPAAYTPRTRSKASAVPQRAHAARAWCGVAPVRSSARGRLTRSGRREELPGLNGEVASAPNDPG